MRFLGEAYDIDKKSILIRGQEFPYGFYILYVYCKVANVRVTAKLYAYSASDSIRIGPINFTVSSPVLWAWILLLSDRLYRYSMQLVGLMAGQRTV
jgi:hypothetical protein